MYEAYECGQCHYDQHAKEELQYEIQLLKESLVDASRLGWLYERLST